MAHCFDRGVLNKSSWHGMEEVGVFSDAESMIEHGEVSGAWPTHVTLAHLVVAGSPALDGLLAPGKAVVATYRKHEPRCLATVGDRYTPTEPSDWRELVAAAVEAGAKPTGSFSLQGGTKVLATFQIDDDEKTGLRTYLVLSDSYDGSTMFEVMCATIRVVCANTLSVARRRGSANGARLKHTATLHDKLVYLKAAIPEAIKSGRTVAEMYDVCRNAVLSNKQFDVVFDRLFPPPSDEDNQPKQTRAHNKRANASLAMSLDENQSRDDAQTCLADLLNTATHQVDRDSGGNAKKSKGGADSLNSLMFGARAAELARINHVIEICLSDGTVQQMTVPDAIAAGVSPQQAGSVTLDAMLEDLN